jgi:hypothetical protein
MIRKEKITRLVLVLVCAVVVTGCFSKEEAQSLVKAGTTSADQLATYYDGLAESVVNGQLLAQYQLGIKFDQEDRDELEQERKAYESRADLARKLKATYTALGNLVDYDAESEVRTATGELLTAVLKQVPHPALFDKAGFQTVIGRIAGKIVEIQQAKEFKSNLPLVQVVLADVGELFERERYVYVQSRAAYEHRVEQLALNLLGTGDCVSSQVSSIAGFQKYIEHYGLATMADRPLTKQICEKNREFSKTAVEQITRDRVARLNMQAKNVSAGLYNLERTFRNLLNKKNLPPPPLTTTDITDFAKLANALRTAQLQIDQWEEAQKAKTANGGAAAKPEAFEPKKAYVLSYLVPMLSPATRERLKKGGGEITSDKFKSLLLDDLNRIVENGNIAEGILSKEGAKNLKTLHAFVLTTDGKTTNQAERTKLEDKLVEEIGRKLKADRTDFAGSPGSPGSLVTTFVVLDPAAKALVRLNRQILSFVFAGAVAAAAETST